MSPLVDLKPGDVVHVRSMQRDGKKYFICLDPPEGDKLGRFLYTNSKKAKMYRGDYEVKSSDLGIDGKNETTIVSYSSVAVFKKSWLDDPANEGGIVGSVAHIAKDLGREAYYHRRLVSDEDARLIERTFKDLVLLATGTVVKSTAATRKQPKRLRPQVKPGLKPAT